MPDAAAVRRSCRTPIVFYGRGANGFEVVTHLHEEMNVTAAPLPEPSRTVGDLIRTTGEEAITALTTLAEGGTLYTRPFENVKADMDGVREAEGNPRPPFEVLVMSEESRLGREVVEVSFALKQLVTIGVRVFC
jgi:hypothetical protein